MRAASTDGGRRRLRAQARADALAAPRRRGARATPANPARAVAPRRRRHAVTPRGEAPSRAPRWTSARRPPTRARAPPPRRPGRCAPGRRAPRARQEGAATPCALDLRELGGVCDYFLIVLRRAARCRSRRSPTRSRRSCARRGARPWHVEGLEGRRWVLLDYVEVVVHVFHEKTREYYLLDRLWGDAGAWTWSGTTLTEGSPRRCGEGRLVHARAARAARARDSARARATATGRRTWRSCWRKRASAARRAQVAERWPRRLPLDPARVRRGRDRRPGVPQLPLQRRRFAARRCRRDRSTRASASAATTTRRGARDPGRVRERQPDRAAQRGERARGRGGGDALVRLLDATGHRADGRVLRQRRRHPGRPARASRCAARFAERAGRRAPVPRGGLPGRVHRASSPRAARGGEAAAALDAPADAAWFRGRGARAHADVAARATSRDYGAEFARWFRESELHAAAGAASRRGRSRDLRVATRPPSTTGRGRDVVRARRALRRRQGSRRGAQQRRARPTCCPTSPTTATSARAASATRSTCGGPTTTATSLPHRRPRSRRSGSSRTSSRC